VSARLAQPAVCNAPKAGPFGCRTFSAAAQACRRRPSGARRRITAGARRRGTRFRARRIGHVMASPIRSARPGSHSSRRAPFAP
jgi:hypothetical protein